MKSLSLTQPHALIMIGVPGSGKSFFAEKFADTFHAPYISHDTVHAILAAPEVAIHKLLLNQLHETMKTGQSLIIEGMATTRTQRNELAKLCRSAGYEPLFIWVQVDDASARQRHKKAKPDVTDEQYKSHKKKFSPPHVSEKAVVISGKHTYATQAKVVLKRLSGPRANISSHAGAPARSLNDVRRSRLV